MAQRRFPARLRATVNAPEERGMLSRMRRTRRLLGMAFLGTLIVGVIAVGSVWVVLQVRRHQPRTLPAPTGAFAVGRTSFDWTDTARPALFSANDRTGRELVVWLWYPAAPAPGAPTAPYVPPQWAKLRDAEHGAGAILFQASDSVRVHAIADAPVAPQRPQYPVLVLEPGMGRLPTDYTSLAEELASHGYIVAGITPTDSANTVVFPDGRAVRSVRGAQIESSADKDAGNRLVSVWGDDVTFTLDRLTALGRDATSGFAGKLDLDHVGLLGHSFGGATALDVCQRERRCAAAIDLDGSPFGAVEQTGLGKPMMCILSEPPTEGDLALLRHIAAAAPLGSAYLLTIAGTRHFNFADDAVMMSPLRLFGLLGPIDGARGLQITREYVRAFFDTFLLGSISPLLRGASGLYPEVRSV